MQRGHDGKRGMIYENKVLHRSRIKDTMGLILNWKLRDERITESETVESRDFKTV